MYRCALAALLACGLHAHADAQVARKFTQYALRGAIVFADYPQIMLNGQPARLAPGARVRDQDNRIVTPGSLAGASAIVNYTVDLGGNQVRDVWILRPKEAAVSPWPTTPEQARNWIFNVGEQTWSTP